VTAGRFGFAGEAAAMPVPRASSATAASTTSRLKSIIRPAVPPWEAKASSAGLVTTDWVDFGARNRARDARRSRFSSCPLHPRHQLKGIHGWASQVSRITELWTPL